MLSTILRGHCVCRGKTRYPGQMVRERALPAALGGGQRPRGLHMTVCKTVFWRYRTQLCFELHGVRIPLVLSARTVASSTRPSRWPAASPPRRPPTLLTCTYYLVLHAMAAMHHDDCSPMIATMNFARCSRTRGVCRQRMPGSRCSALPRGPCSSPWRLAALSCKAVV